MLASVILSLRSILHRINPYNTTVLTQYILYIYYFTIYYSSFIVILAGIRASSYMTLIKPASKPASKTI
jgi:hypothetical protein